MRMKGREDIQKGNQDDAYHSLTTALLQRLFDKL